MAIVLPPVQSAQAAVHGAGYPATELKCKLSQLRQIQVNAARTEVNLELEVLRKTHVRNEEQRQDSLMSRAERLRRHEARQGRMKMKIHHVTKIQAVARSFFVRRFILPSVLEAKAKEELENSRVALADTMLCLHQNIHDLAHLEKDRCRGATRIQAWWRGVLAKRVVAIISLRHHLVRVGYQMGKAATRIAAYARGRQARMGCFLLRLEKEKRMQQEREKQQFLRIKAIVRVQSHVRRRRAMKNIAVRREQAAKGREGEGAANESREGGKMTSNKSPDKGERSRRRRKDEGQGTIAAKHRTALSSDQVGYFEAGGMLVGEMDPELRKADKSGVPSAWGASRQKVRRCRTQTAALKRVKTTTFHAKIHERQSLA